MLQKSDYPNSLPAYRNIASLETPFITPSPAYPSSET